MYVLVRKEKYNQCNILNNQSIGWEGNTTPLCTYAGDAT